LGETQSCSHNHEFGKGTLHTGSSKKNQPCCGFSEFVFWVNIVALMGIMT